jgi:hypothetical protein
VLGRPAVRNEPEVLHEGALATTALDAERTLEQPRALAAPPAGRRTRTAPTHTVGMGGLLPKRDDAAATRDSWLSLLDQGLGVTNDIWKRYATSRGRDRAALDKAAADALEAFVKAEGEKLVEAVPFGKAILVSVELSLAFAEGVGRGLETVNTELGRKYDLSRLGSEVTEADLAQLRLVRGYLAESTRQLNRVIAEGLAEVAKTVTETLLDKVGEVPKKVLDSVAGQVASQLVKQNDLLAVFREAVDKAGKSIPEGRRKVEALAFRFVSKAFLDQLTNKDLQKRLAGLPAVATSDKPVDVALLGSVIKILVEGSYDTYARHVPVATASAELKQMLVNAARGLAAGLVDVRLEASDSSTVVVERDRVAVPVTWLATLTQSPDLVFELENRWRAREAELVDFIKRLKVSLLLRRRQLEQRFRAEVTEDTYYELHQRYQDQWRVDWAKAHARANAAVDAVVAELGEGWKPGYSRVMLEPNVWTHLGRVNECGLFTPFRP